MMTMWPRSSHAVPAGTAQVARAAFPKGCLAIRIRDALGELFEDTQFAGLFAVRGRPAVSPARLALVLVLQFVEGLSDRQAADAVRGRIDWKYALGLELTDTGFDASVLSEFRARLVDGDAAQQLLERMLERLRVQGLLVQGGRQRTDATCVVAAVRELNRLELVVETLRAALEALAAAAPSWLLAMVPEDWYQRYGQRASDYRLPQATAARAALAVMVGADGFALLDAVHATDAPVWLRQVPSVQTLRAVWIQQYYRDRNGLRWRGKGEVPPAALAIDATAVTSCPTCEVELRVELREGEPVDTEERLRLWLPQGRCDHLVEDFCSHANLYCTSEHLAATVPKGSPGRIVAVADAAAIGRQTWDDAAAALGDEVSGDA